MNTLLCPVCGQTNRLLFPAWILIDGQPMAIEKYNHASIGSGAAYSYDRKHKDPDVQPIPLIVVTPREEE